MARRLDITNRHAVNKPCRQLAKDSLIVRQRENGKIHNFPAGNVSTIETIAQTITIKKKPKSDLWFWEGNVQSRVVQYLQSQNYRILSQADTASHQHGKDIVAEKDGKIMWVTVKGYPKGSERTRHQTQSRHWFSHAIFDIILYREENKEVQLAVALPDFQTYKKLAQKTTWLRPAANFVFYWVSENGEILTE